MHHQAWSSDDALVFITVDSGWDVNWVSGPPTRSNLGQRAGRESPIAPHAERRPAGTVLASRVRGAFSFLGGENELATAIASGPPGSAQAEESGYRRFARRVRLCGKHLRDEAAAESGAGGASRDDRAAARWRVRRPDGIGSFILGTSRMLAGSAERKTRRRDLTALFHRPELYAEPAFASGDIAVVGAACTYLRARPPVLVLTFCRTGEIAGTPA
jgi:hypothetical protein